MNRCAVLSAGALSLIRNIAEQTTVRSLGIYVGPTSTNELLPIKQSNIKALTAPRFTKLRTSVETALVLKVDLSVSFLKLHLTQRIMWCFSTVTPAILEPRVCHVTQSTRFSVDVSEECHGR